MDKANALDLQDIDFDGDNDETLKQKALQGAQHAIQTQLEQTRQFDEGSKQRRAEAQAERELDGEANDDEFMNPSSLRTDLNIEQPKILMCQLKNYQLKGLNWLANLYELGINGILADEMGLGKTVQAISLLSYLAETHNLWGPFIVITPASTLHNWSDELQKFVPSFKVLPYWGSVKDRAILRQDWSKKKLYSKDAPFHILVTSYQMILTDEKYLSRIKWQYMVLDEAQAIKSSSSSRWKTLRKFNCRNRLLLTGTPIQNNMQELWALLNFIMPSLFDSHDEFSEWFSKDIENHAENKGALNEHQVKRLHMILKPFMLRRVKRSVQNELPEKIELEIMCDLTNRQQKLYSGLKENMSLSSLLEKSKSLTDKDNVDSLMNLVMQLRKVCNHPELFKRAEIESSFAFAKYQAGNHIYDNYISYVTKNPIELRLPSFFDDEPQPVELATHTLRHKLLYQTLNIWSKDFIYKSQYENDDTLPSLVFSSQESQSISNGDIEELYRSNSKHEHTKDLMSYKSWDNDGISSNCLEDSIEIFTPEDLIKHSALFSIRATEEFEKNIAIPGVKQCYLHPAVAPPITVISNNVQSNKSHQENLFHPLYQQLATANTSLVNQYIRNSDRLPSSFQDTEAFSSVHVPNPEKLVLECGKLKKLDEMLPKLKAEGHRILMYFQMTKMIDIVEEYLSFRKYSFLRLDGSSKISDRRDMVNDWQTCPELFIFLLSTRAGGLGINLTAADTVIFYDSDWNPTVDQQAMDRAHRLGQTRQVTVYRMVTRNSIEERILERARQKDEIHRVVISGGEYKPLDFKPKEIVSLLLDDQAPEATQSPAVAESGDQKYNANGSLSTPSASAGSKRSVGIDDLLSPANDIKKSKVEEIFP
jgi:DNA helicase INO80